MKVLCIAIGNSLRGDDGVAHAIAARLDAGGELVVRRSLQLSPEIASEIAEAGAAVFIDADLDASEPTIEAVAEGAARGTPLLHHLTPGEVVRMARGLYGFTGPAYLCRVPVESFDGEGLSAAAEAGASGALRLLREFLKGLTHESGCAK